MKSIQRCFFALAAGWNVGFIFSMVAAGRRQVKTSGRSLTEALHLSQPTNDLVP